MKKMEKSSTAYRYQELGNIVSPLSRRRTKVSQSAIHNVWPFQIRKTGVKKKGRDGKEEEQEEDEEGRGG